jgi:hypothetical protein
MQDDQAVLDCFMLYSRKIHDQLEKIKDAVEVLGKAAGIAILYGDDEESTSVRETAERMVEEYRELKFVMDAVVYLASKGNPSSYAVAKEPTNFQTLIEDTVVKLKGEERRSFDVDAHPLMKAFVSIQNSVSRAEDSIEKIDEDIELQGGGTSSWKNSKCPLSMKDIMELKEPVEDSHGFVYEKEALSTYMGQMKPNRQGKFKCPVAATELWITREEMKPAHRLLKMKTLQTTGKY